MRFTTFFNASEKLYNEGMANGERKHYDACSTQPLEKAKEYYKGRYTYIGSGYTTWHNGVKNNWKDEHHFFILTPNAIHNT